MRFGISATSSIFPKNLRTRLRPVNVCAIVASFFLGPPGMGSGVLQRSKTPAPEDVRGWTRNLFHHRHAVIVMPNPAATKHQRPGNRELLLVAVCGDRGNSDQI